MRACVQCGASFRCGMVDGPASEPCWCIALPPLPAALLATATAADRCFCPDCLKALLDRPLDD